MRNLSPISQTRQTLSLKRKLSLGCAACLASTVLPLAAMAETVARANGRCSLKDDNYQVYNGYCTIKQKQNGNTAIFVIELENGNHFRVSGPSRQRLSVETASGMNERVQYEDLGNKGVFSWDDGDSTHRLAVKTDTVTNPNAPFDDHPSASIGTALATAAVGALISGLLGGGRTASPPSGAIGQPVPGLQDLIGADPGFVESRLTSAGYTYIQIGTS